MNVPLPDELVRELGWTERQFRLEAACALYDADKLDCGQASRLAGMDRDAFEAELGRRGISTFRYTEECFRQDMETLEHWRRQDEAALRQDRTGEGRAA